MDYRWKLSKTLELRINECDTIFLLDFPTQVCLEGAKSRIGQKRRFALGRRETR